MSHEWMTLDELSEHLGRDRRELERLVHRGRLPSHKRGGVWMFHSAEITEWLEREMRDYSDSQLAAVEFSQQRSEQRVAALQSYLTPELVQVPLEARTRRSVLEGLVEVAGRTWKIWKPAVVLKALVEREQLMSTAFDSGVAIPHPRQPLVDAIEDSLVAYGRTLSPIPYGAPGGGGTDIYFLVLSTDTRTHLQLLARIGRLIQHPEALDRLRAAPDSSSSFAVLSEIEASLG